MPTFRLLVVLLLTGSVGFAAEIAFYDGKRTYGELISVDAKEIVFKTSAGEERIDPTKVSFIHFSNPQQNPPNAKWHEVQLIDGTQFRVSDFSLKGKDASFTQFNTGSTPVTFTTPRANVFYIMRDMHDLKVGQRFREVMTTRRKFDRWLFERQNLVDALDGTFGDADATGEKLSFTQETGQKNDLTVARVYGMILNPQPTEIAQTLCRVVDLNNNELYVRSVAIVGKKITFTTAAGAVVEYPGIGSIAKFDYSSAAIRFLSDLTPSKIDQPEEPTLHYLKDGAPGSSRSRPEKISLGSKQYDRGLTLASRTALTYDLGQKFKTLEGLAGADDVLKSDSFVDTETVLIIEADGKQVYRQVIKKSDAAKVLNIQMTGVNKLRIIVESNGTGLAEQDFLSLGDVKLRR